MSRSDRGILKLMIIKIKIVITIVTLSLLIIFSCEDDPVKPENHHPIIKSLTAFPDVVGVQDSVIIICNAYDPDGDTVVYYWITDARVRIKGTPSFDEQHLFHTFENSRIVYPKEYNNIPIDTAWIQCCVRDVKGGMVCEVVNFIVLQDSVNN